MLSGGLLVLVLPEMAVPTCCCSTDNVCASYWALSLPALDLAQAELGPDRSDQYADDFLVYFRFPFFPAEAFFSLPLPELELAEEEVEWGGGGGGVV